MNDSLAVISEHFPSLAATVLLQSTAMMAVGLIVGRVLRGRGPTWQSLAYRATIAAVAATFVVTLAAAGRVPRAVSLEPRVAPAIELRYEGEQSYRTAIGTTPSPDSPSNPPSAAPPAIVAKAITLSTQLITAGRQGRLPIALWFCVVLVALLRQVAGRRSLARLTRESNPVNNGEAHQTLLEIAANLQVPVPALLSHSAVRSPFLAGIRRPSIFLPADYESRYDAATIRAILAHETAHIARRDCAWFLLARLAAIILWFQPLIWLLERRLVHSSEEACDAAVIDLGIPERQYADSLLSLVERAVVNNPPAYSIGVAPKHSAVGRRIRLILEHSRQFVVRISSVARFGVTLVTSVATIFAVLIFCPPALRQLNLQKENVDEQSASTMANFSATPWTPPAGYADQFRLCSQHGWSSTTVRSIGYNLPSVAASEQLPLGVTNSDFTLMKACFAGSYGYWHSKGVGYQFGNADPDARSMSDSKQVLAEHPHYFFAEYQIAVWYATHNRLDLFKVWRDRSLADAPAILAGRVTQDDGTPIAGFTFAPSVDYCQSNADAPCAFVTYEQVVTDSNGCYYLPVFKGVYSRSGEMFSVIPPYSVLERTMTCESDNIGEFVSDARVGLLPPQVFRHYIALSGRFGTTSGSVDHPLKISARQLSVAWSPYPDATTYDVELTKCDRDRQPGHQPVGAQYYLSTEQQVGALDGFNRPRSAKTILNMELDGTKPAFNRTKIYMLRIIARHGAQQYAESRYIYFTVTNGAYPAPVTKAGIEEAIPGSTVQSISRQNGKMVVRGTVNSAAVFVNCMSEPDAFAKPIASEQVTYTNGPQNASFSLTF